MVVRVLQLGVAGDIGEAFGRERGSSGTKRGTALQHGEQRHVGMHRPLEEQADAIAGMDAAAAQVMGEPVRLGVEVGVAKRSSPHRRAGALGWASTVRSKKWSKRTGVLTPGSAQGGRMAEVPFKRAVWVPLP